VLKVGISRRNFLESAAAVTGASLISDALPLRGADAATPEMFGARGDGVTNDTDAFAAMAAAINRAGGGIVALRRTTYIVGRQIPEPNPAGWAYSPAPIMQFHDLHAPLTIHGNGARLQCAKGLRYGLFDRNTGEIFHHALPYYDLRQLASPYVAMISVKNCAAPFELSDLELDGNLPNLRIGGPYGDTGYQIPAIGLFLEDNKSTETIRNLHSHHHGQDGIEINGDDRRASRSRFENVVSEYNGRQGVSVIGGRGYDFIGCKFNHTGRSSVQSAPAAGVDIEAEGSKIVRDLTFTDCEFSNNVGCGMVADAGDGAGATFTRCKFIGTTNWSAWALKPRLVFRGCLFVGTLVHPFPSRDPALAAQFHDCRFRDDPRLSPNGKVYLAGYKQHAIVDMAESDNVLFNRCSFVLTHDGLLPWSWRAIYSNCVMRQAAAAVAYPKGNYLGSSTIVGNVNLYNSKIIGMLTLNGKLIPKGLQGGKVW
jgi:hypothetical protein